jgi:NAD(P)H-dependent FMN reductase
MKILAFAGSISSTSINKQLVEVALREMESVDIEVLDLNDYEMPIYSEDREKNGFPSQIIDFTQKIEEADAIVCALAEHNRTYSSGFKNILDWAFRVDKQFFKNKPMLLLSTTTVENGSVNVMKTATTFFPLLGADLRESFIFPNFTENYNSKMNEIVNESLKNDLNDIIQRFKQGININ